MSTSSGRRLASVALPIVETTRLLKASRYNDQLTVQDIDEAVGVSPEHGYTH